ncbi:hypothetical protein ACFQ1S_00365 [Kibdelosporangium lantanae]|uniref:Uncharacterized protein n=1 Tax=Kibdelosporangium lantanae TaxID=1497396 RepID=A0ABW3M462_9PSEU
MAFNATWVPGPNAVAGLQRIGTHGPPVLVIYVDPDSLAIPAPRTPSEYPAFARFLRELATSAAEMAVLLDPNGQEGRHALFVRYEYGDEGTNQRDRGDGDGLAGSGA